jgi:predicted RNase H-like nuclease (RuvC/YqgF family)
MWLRRLAGDSGMEKFSTLYPVLAAVVTGIFGLVTGPRLAAFTARKARQAREEERQRVQDAATAAAKIEAAETDRAQISSDWQWIVGNLRDEVKALIADQRILREELNKLSTELDIVRRTNSQLTYDNGVLRQQVTDETSKRQTLERRVDQLTAQNIILSRELSRHGITIPPLALEQP